VNKTKIIFYSIVPSPYQRDLFYALSQLPELELQVCYLEESVADSPWPEKPLQLYEKVLAGTHLKWGASRFHLNWHLPNLSNIDVVVFNGYQNIVTQWILRTKGRNIPCIFWGETMLGSRDGIKGKIQRVFADSLNQCAAIAAIGTKAQKDYQQRFPNKPIFNIPYYCDLTEFSQNRPERPKNPVTIVFCGQMIARKGVDLLLKAFSRIIDDGLQAKLLLVGREAELPQMMSNLPQKVQDCIEYAGFQAPEALPEFFRQADIFVLPSRYDGWGVVVNQALGAGLPIICSDTVGAGAELVEQGKNGWIVPVGDVDALYEALKKYVQNPTAIKAASEASIAKSASWVPEVGARRWLEVFQKVQ
jgi:glycosyltransferase involved in cell wall biosynthesis